MKKFLLLLSSLLLCLLSFARDFTYNNINYTVIDENAKLIETKAGHIETVDGEEKKFAGNDVSGVVIMPSTVEYDGVEYTLARIGDLSFYGNYISVLWVPTTVEAIGDEAFSLCILLDSPFIANKKCKLGKSCFAGCMSIKSVTLPKQLTELNNMEFAVCLALKEITWPENLEKIGSSVFSMCGLEEVAIPNTVTSIGVNAFNLCASLKNITLPTNLQEISLGAFTGCSLTDINYPSVSPCFAFKGIFDEDAYQVATLHVPAGSKNVFENTSPWKYFQNIVEGDDSGVANISTENSESEYYDLTGMRVAHPAKGQILIKRTGSKTEKIIF